MNIFFGTLLIILGVLLGGFNLKKQAEKANYTLYPIIPLLLNLITIGALIFGVVFIIS